VSWLKLARRVEEEPSADILGQPNSLATEASS
jgi:hypothetical protein